MDFGYGYNMIPIDEGDYSTLFGMNGGNPESPDGKRIVYGRKKDVLNNRGGETEIWICDRDLSNKRHLFTTDCGNHNGPSASFIDNDRIVFRGGSDADPAGAGFYVLDVNTGKVLIGPICGKEGHRSEQHKFPFCVTQRQIEKNPGYPVIDEEAIYSLDCDTGVVTKVMPMQKMLDLLASKRLTPNAWTTSVSHVQFNPACTKVMMRAGVNEIKDAALVCYNIPEDSFDIILIKPIHQLWYDDNTYIACFQYNNGNWVSERCRINRYTTDGKIVENLGGVGNHVDISHNREWVLGDTFYPGEPIKINLFKKGKTTPYVLDGHTEYDLAWKLQVHSNPCFGSDDTRVYFNRPVAPDKTVAVYVDIADIIANHK